MKELFLWPVSKNLLFRDFLTQPPTNEGIEVLLRELYPDSEPVLFSSARAGLSAILQMKNLIRSDLVWCPNYSSHCVIESIARHATPTPILTGDTKVALIYHQWGFGHTASFDSSIFLIEDSVDSLLIPHKSPFLIGGSFVLWSLPKVFGTMSGGVIFCKNRDDATILRSIRRKRSISFLEKSFRYFLKSYLPCNGYWNGTESVQGEVMGLYRHQILRALKSINSFLTKQKQLLSKVTPELIDRFEEIARYPSNLPLDPKLSYYCLSNKEAKIKSGLRHFNSSKSYPNQIWTQVLPIPVHADVAYEDISVYFKK